MINEVSNKLINNEQVAEVEFREVFEEIFSGLANEIQTTSFITALNFKEIEDDAIISAIETSSQAINRPFNLLYSDNLMENIALKKEKNIFDISLIQDLVCSCAQLYVSRYAFDCQQTLNQSFNILKLLGINLKKKVDYNDVEFEKLNFNYYYLSSNTPYFKYSEAIRNNLAFDNIFNATKEMLNPTNAKNLFLGVSRRALVEKYANICLKLQKNNSIVVCGNDSLPFIAPNGESYIAEAWKNKIFTYVINPELLGYNEHDFSEINCTNDEENANDIFEIIYNKKKDTKYELSILNSALSLYIAKKADSIIDGINLAKRLLDDGIVAQKFEQIKKFYC